MGSDIALGLASLLSGLAGGVGQSMADKAKREHEAKLQRENMEQQAKLQLSTMMEQAKYQAKAQEQAMISKANLELLIQKAQEGDTGFFQTKEGSKLMKGYEAEMPMLMALYQGAKTSGTIAQKFLEREQQARGFGAISTPLGEQVETPRMEIDPRSPSQVSVDRSIQEQLQAGKYGKAGQVFQNHQGLVEQAEIQRLQLDKLRSEVEENKARALNLRAQPEIEAAKLEANARNDLQKDFDKRVQDLTDSLRKQKVPDDQAIAIPKALYGGDPQQRLVAAQFLARLGGAVEKEVAQSGIAFSKVNTAKALDDLMGEMAKNNEKFVEGGIRVDQFNQLKESHNNAIFSMIGDELQKAAALSQYGFIQTPEGKIIPDERILPILQQLNDEMAKEFMTAEKSSWLWKSYLSPKYASQLEGLKGDTQEILPGQSRTIKTRDGMSFQISVDPKSGQIQIPGVTAGSGGKVEGGVVKTGEEVPVPGKGSGPAPLIPPSDLEPTAPGEVPRAAMRPESGIIGEGLPSLPSVTGTPSPIQGPAIAAKNLGQIVAKGAQQVADTLKWRFSDLFYSSGEERRKDLRQPTGAVQGEIEVARTYTKGNLILWHIANEKGNDLGVRKEAEELRKLRSNARGWKGTNEIPVSEVNRLQYLENKFADKVNSILEKGQDITKKDTKGLYKVSPEDVGLGGYQGSALGGIGTRISSGFGEMAGGVKRAADIGLQTTGKLMNQSVEQGSVLIDAVVKSKPNNKEQLLKEKKIQLELKRVEEKKKDLEEMEKKLRARFAKTSVGG